MGRAVMTRGVDAYVRQDYPDRNFSTPAVLRMRNSAASIISYLYRVPPDVPRGALITNATLTFTLAYDAPAGEELRLYTCMSDYSMSKMTWDEGRPDVTNSRFEPVGTGERGTRVTFDVTPEMQTFADGGDWWGWCLYTTSDEIIAVHSYEAEGFRPELAVEWSDAPLPPEGLEPSGGQAVSVPAPVVTWTSQDVSGDTSIQAVQVQVNGTDSWGAPAWDSGAVASTESDLDLAAAGYAGAAEGVTLWWRVRTQDGAGLWSDWSDAAQWRYLSLPSLTITTPTDGGTVERLSPRIEWTLGVAQSQYQVLVYREGNPSNILWQTGRVTSSASGVSVPAEALRRDRTFVAEVRAWDGQDRVATPGALARSVATVTFDLDRDGSQTAPTDLTVTPGPDQLSAVLSWERDPAPAGWVVLRDGDVIAELDHADVSTGGLGASWSDWTLRPQTEGQVYEVAPVVNGNIGASATIDAPALRVTGVWVLDAEAPEGRVCLHQEGLDNWALREQSVEHEPLRSPSPVVITYSHGGVRGALAGRLLADHDGPGYHDYVNRWLAIRDQPGKTFRLVAADRNIPVILWGMTERPAPYGPHMASDVSAQFAQSGEHEGGPR